MTDKINFVTDQLVIMHYPERAGGKFVQLALALHPKILFIDDNLARLKMKQKFSPRQSFKVSMWPLQEKTRVGAHTEFSCEKFAGFNSDHLEKDPLADEKMCNDLWTMLTNQSEYYFLMTEHSNANPWSRYINRKTISCINYEWIREKRKTNGRDILCDDKPKGNTSFIYFDMNSIKNDKSFANEIYKMYDFLKIPEAEDTDFFQMLDQLRKKFLDSFSEGFNSKRKQLGK